MAPHFFALRMIVFLRSNISGSEQLINADIEPSLLLQYDPSIEHAATNQMVAESPHYRIFTAQLISVIQIGGLTSAFALGFFTCQFALTADGFFFLARFAN